MKAAVVIRTFLVRKDAVPYKVWEVQVIKIWALFSYNFYSTALLKKKFNLSFDLTDVRFVLLKRKTQ